MIKQDAVFSTSRAVRRLACAAVFCWAANSAFAFDLNVTINGADNGLQDAVRSAALLSSLAEDADARGSDVIAAAKADYQRIVGVLFDRGHFAPNVSITLNGREASTLGFSDRLQTRNARISVTPGPPYRFGRAEISPLAPGTTPPDAFRSGEPASLGAMRSAVSTGISDWRDSGHAKADLGNQAITARHGDAVLDTTITLSPGPQLTFGQLSVSGDTSLSAARVRQIAGLPTGEVFDPDEVDRATTRLRRTGVFSSVAASEAETIGPNDTLNIDVQLQDAPLRRFGFGAEISTQEGLELSAYWLHRNFLGGGERLRFDISAGGIGGDTGGEDFELGIAFTKPGFPTYRTDWYINGDVFSLSEPNFDADVVSLETGLVHTSSDQRQYSYGVGIRAAETVSAFGTNTYRILTLPLTHTRDYRNNDLNATSGYFAEFALTPFLSLSGTDDGARLYIDGRAYRSVGTNDRVTFALRGQLGSLFGPSLSTAPTDYLFFSGGGGTVRGQDFQSLGIEQANGLISGGRSFLGGSAELRVKTGENLSVVGFWDVGYIGAEEFPDGTSGDWHSGAGAGIRYDTGVGPIRFDVAVPVSGPGANDGFEIYIGIGQAF